MSETTYRNRRAVQLENAEVRVTVLLEGGHIAEIVHKATGVNPLWTPPWPSVEPSAYRQDQHQQYGGDSESKLLAGIMGHNLCLDLFGPPSDEEARAGMTVHGEASIAPYSARESGKETIFTTTLPGAQIRFERTLRLDGARLDITERVENLAILDRPIAWTQHVTLGPPFLEPGKTEFRASATRSKTFEGDFGGVLATGAEFTWPAAPKRDGGTYDLRRYTDAPQSAGYTTHLMDPGREHAFCLAWSPSSKVFIGYEWKRADFPWLGLWEENRSRQSPPWNGVTITRGLEFGVSPMPETRRQMIERRSLFGTPSYRWLPARGTLRVNYSAVIGTANSAPEEL